MWKEHTSTIGNYVNIETFGKKFEGLATDVDSTGALILKSNNGQLKKIIYGDCFYKENN